MDQSVNNNEEYKDYYETICSMSPVGLFRTDENGLIVYVNERYEKLTGKTLEELKGTGWIDTIHTSDSEKVVSEWQRCIDEHKKFVLEYRVEHKNKRVVWILGQATPINGTSKGYVGTITNINKRKTLLNELVQMKGDN